MSRVLLIAADQSLPLCNYQESRTEHIKAAGQHVTLTLESGFKVEEHRYYRAATDELGYPIKPYQYELSLEKNETDLQNLRDYLTQHLSPGQTVQLWNLWVGDLYGVRRPVQHCGRLADFDMETLEQFFPDPLKDNPQCWLTITV